MSVILINATADRLPLESGSVHLCVTSPPYLRVRKYEGADRQLGQEELHDCLGWARGTNCGECYVCKTRAWAGEVHRVLRDDGTFWLNIGDSYNESGGAGGDYNAGGLRDGQPKYGRKSIDTLKERDMIGVPWRVALALQADGWYLRSEIIWRKVNPMPFPLFGWRWERHMISIPTDDKDEYERLIAEEMDRTGANRNYAGRNMSNMGKRPALKVECPGCRKCKPNGGYVLRRTAWRPTSSHEQIFLFSKTAKYYCDHIAVQEPITNTQGGNQTFGSKSDNRKYSGNEYDKDRDGKNMRDVVEFKQSTYKGDHFAVYPMGLPEMAIKAGTSEAGVCQVCGSPWARVLDSKSLERYELPKDSPNYRPARYSGKYQKIQGENGGGMRYNQSTMLGWQATCDCCQICDSYNRLHGSNQCKPYDPVPSTVLDPFCGSGTTGLVARSLGRYAILSDLSMQYLVQDARTRLELDRLYEWENGVDGAGDDLSELPMFKGLNPPR